MTLLWPDAAQQSSQASLRQVIYRLQESVSLPEGEPQPELSLPLLLTSRSTVKINPAAQLDVDIISFRHLIAEVNAHDHEALHNCTPCLQKLETAVSHYHGDFLSDLYLRDNVEFEQWSAAIRTELRQAVLIALEELGNAALDLGQLGTAEKSARRMLSIDPLRETAQQLLMLVLARSGKKVEALAQFDLFSRQLAEELEVTPAADSVALYKRIEEGRLDSTDTPDHDGIEVDTADIPSGQQIREYEVREKFASGTFSTIYRAYQPAVRREVAIKVILPKFANLPEFMRRWEAEAHIVARIEHPHIVPLYDYWRDDGGIYLIMRLLRGGNLRHRLSLGPLSPQEILLIMQQVGGALHAVHQQGIVHRDLKPANILLDEQGNAYLTDFGIAKELAVDTRMTVPGTVLGSPAYISPEQLRNQTVTPQTDIYSLGIILYELLTGNHPYAIDRLAPLIQQHLYEPLPSLLEDHPHLPIGLDWVLSRATSKQAEARYNDVPSFLDELEQALAGQPETIGESIWEVPPLPPATRLSPPAPLPVPFVARERQLARLESFLDNALSGDGQMVFITGGAGRGKTSLLAQFARQAMAAHPNLLLASGICNATAAAGDPYLPFRELLTMLTAGVDARLRAGTISPDHAQRLRTALPRTGKAVVEEGPELVDALVSGSALLARGKSALPAGSPWLDRLAEMLDGDTPYPGTAERKRLFAHFTAVLHSISQYHPLILILDDLQWIDKASAGLLFHLSRNLSGYPILFASAYRGDEVALGRDGERHPLEKALAESKRAFGDIWIDLAELQEAEELHFVNTLLDQEPHHFSDSFRQALYDHTAGHALFTVELLRAMQERGDLQRDEDGRWVESNELDWEQLPLRIEGVIEERTNRLDEELRSLLSTAAVEGEQFTAEVLARVHGGEPRQTMHLLSRQLQALHHLVIEQDELQIGNHYLTRYRFTHPLVQHYLYSRLSAGERRLLHAQVADALEELLQDNWQPYAATFAWQFKQAGRLDKALRYWLWLGDRARAIYAHAEAESSYRQAIDVLRNQKELELAGRTALKLALVYTADFQTEKATETYNEAFTLWDPAHSSPREGSGILPEATLRLAVTQPNSLDPGLIRDEASTFLASQLFEGLVRVGEGQMVLPALANRWEVLDGGKRYRFHLRPDALWNDGERLTAGDFVYAFTRNLHPDTNASQAHLLYVLKNARAFAAGDLEDPTELGISARDDHTLELTLERPIAYLPHLMAQTVAFPLPRRAIEAAAEQWTEPQYMVSNGPYQLQESQDEKRLLLSRNPHYQRQIRGNVQHVDCTIITDYKQILQAFGQDQLDAVNLTFADPETIAQVQTSFADALVSIPRWSTFYLSFRCDKPPFDDRHVRQAFAYALDRQALTAEVFPGLRRAATGGFLPPGMPGYSENIALAYDPQKARELLSDAGYAGGQGFPPVEWAASPGGEHLISFIRSAWQENLGLALKPVRMDWEVFMEKLNDDSAQLTLLGWGADFPDPQNMLQATFHSQEGINLPRWQNAQFDKLTAAAESVIDHSRRMALYQEADRILVAEETAVLPLSYDQGRILVKPWVRLPPSPMITMPLRLVTVVRPTQP